MWPPMQRLLVLNHAAAKRAGCRCGRWGLPGLPGVVALKRCSVSIPYRPPFVKDQISDPFDRRVANIERSVEASSGELSSMSSPAL